MDSPVSDTTTVPIEVIFQQEYYESSEEPPMEEWSSLEIVPPEENKKKILHQEGLYDPGSGEVCTKYITMSASSVLRHPYFCYPAIKDPGIEKALLEPEAVLKYPDDGQALYLDMCEEMKQCPVRSFHKGLLGSKIDLRYYCVNADGIRAMAAALRYNKTVKSLNFTDNFLNDDASFHLGNMLITNSTITELNLRGCRIGPGGAMRLLHNLPHNKGLVTLDLSYNQLGDEGMTHLAKAIFYGLDVKKINLAYNNITGKGVMHLVDSFETHNKFTHINLSWNKLYTPGGAPFLMKLSETSTTLQVLDLSWNALGGPKFGFAIKSILECPLIKKLNLSNNKFEGEALAAIASNLTKAKRLQTLHLSYNPLTPADALTVLNKVRMVASKLQKLYMENVFVDGEFLSLLDRIKRMKSKKNVVVTYGGVVSKFVGIGPDPRDLILNRVEYLAKKPKKNKVDIALFMLQLQKENRSIMGLKEFIAVIEEGGLRLDDSIVDELFNVFPGAASAKFKTININLMVEYMKRKWPDRQLPPTPPPEPEPEPVPVPVKPKKKGKK
ncbi:leucine-rich repeat-containing protein 74B [Helicoverpa armigera]|uniref:leucine-rich repeat-containing protein 74B n=1 Tax=Helicoverpa armigera TaxID=29058 RepID=UPI0030830FF0